MTEINSSNLIDQMRIMIAQAQGNKTEAVNDQSSFGTVFKQALNQVSESNNTANDLKARFEMGDPNLSLSNVMVETQKATLGFQATLMVRNKIVQAYTDIMNMPI